MATYEWLYPTCEMLSVRNDDLCDGDPLGVAEWSACCPLYATKRLLVVVQEWEMTSFAWKYFR